MISLAVAHPAAVHMCSSEGVPLMRSLTALGAAGLCWHVSTLGTHSVHGSILVLHRSGFLKSSRQSMAATGTISSRVLRKTDPTHPSFQGGGGGGGETLAKLEHCTSEIATQVCTECSMMLSVV